MKISIYSILVILLLSLSYIAFGVSVIYQILPHGYYEIYDKEISEIGDLSTYIFPNILFLFTNEIVKNQIFSYLITGIMSYFVGIYLIYAIGKLQSDVMKAAVVGIFVILSAAIQTASLFLYAFIFVR